MSSVGAGSVPYERPCWLELDPVSFNLRELVEETARALALRAHEKGVELIGDVLPEVPEY